MAKIKKKKIRTIIGIVVTLLLLLVIVGLMANFDTIFGKIGNDGNIPNNEGNAPAENPQEGTFTVYFGDIELTHGEAFQSAKSTTTLRIESSEEYVASFVAVPDYKAWSYEIDGEFYLFKPEISVLRTEIKDNVATVVFPFDIMEWVLLQNEGVTEEQVTLPTDINHNEPYIALRVEVDSESYIYPIKFDLNGVWTKVFLDKDEIVFCD